MLYKNEYQFIEGGSQDNPDQILYEKIQVQFPSPATLSMTALTEQITVADQNADFISNALMPQTSAQEREKDRLRLKTEILKDLLPSIKWEEYEKMKEKIENDVTRDKITVATTGEGQEDPYGGAY